MNSTLENQVIVKDYLKERKLDSGLVEVFENRFPEGATIPELLALFKIQENSTSLFRWFKNNLPFDKNFAPLNFMPDYILDIGNIKLSGDTEFKDKIIIVKGEFRVQEGSLKLINSCIIAGSVNVAGKIELTGKSKISSDKSLTSDELVMNSRSKIEAPVVKFNTAFLKGSAKIKGYCLGKNLTATNNTKISGDVILDEELYVSQNATITGKAVADIVKAYGSPVFKKDIVAVRKVFIDVLDNIDLDETKVKGEIIAPQIFYMDKPLYITSLKNL